MAFKHFLPNRNDVAGAFGDLGTFIPLTVGVIVAGQLEAGNVMIAFGICYLISALIYRMPMPVQPMKAIAALAIAGGATAATIAGSGLMIGVLMFLLAVTGSLEWFAKITPRVAVRGIQFGLALTLMITATRFMWRSGVIDLAGVNVPYLALATICFAIVLVLFDNRKIPSLLIVAPIGIGLATFGQPLKLISLQPSLPTFHLSITPDGVLAGLLTLTLPQIPLTIGNSILATNSLAESLFPKRNRATVRRLGLTLGSMNLFSSLVGGIPMCHGAGGLAAHYRFGARTAAAPALIGVLLLSFGLFYGNTLATILNQFPLPILGVILLFAALELASTIRDMKKGREFLVVVGIAIICAFVPYGFVFGWILGIVTVGLTSRRREPVNFLMSTAVDSS